MAHHLRIARPASDIRRMAQMYRAGLGMAVLGAFEDHDGFDGIMVGEAGGAFHLEFTVSRRHALRPRPTTDDLLVFYVPDAEWSTACERMAGAGFMPVGSPNPYWEANARTFADPDGYRVVLHRGPWSGGGQSG